MNKLFTVTTVCLLVLLTSCQKEESSNSNLQNLPYSLEELGTMEIEVSTALIYTEDLINLKDAPDEFTEKVFEIGDPYKNLELMCAILISQRFEKSDILWAEEFEEEINPRNGSTAYQWDGSSTRKWSIWCFCYKYRADKKVALANPCAAYPISTRWRKCNQLDCPPFPPQCN